MQKLVIILSQLFITLLFTPVIFADTLSNTDYNLNLQHIEIKGGVNDPPLPTSLPQTAALPGHSSTPAPQVLNSSIKESSTEIGMKISQRVLDFGKLTATNPSIRDTGIIARTSNKSGMSMFLQEDHQLSLSNTKEIIPNTSCDTGLCTPMHTDAWTNLLTYGFGYSCSGDACLSDSLDTFFQPFADQEKDEEFSLFAASLTASGFPVTIHTKLNIAGTTVNGTYSNTVTILALPNL